MNLPISYPRLFSSQEHHPLEVASDQEQKLLVGDKKTARWGKFEKISLTADKNFIVLINLASWRRYEKSLSFYPFAKSALEY